MGAIDLITVARQFGAGGSDIAAALGKALGWRVLDRELLNATATLLKTEERDVARVDEYALNALERIAASFTLASPETITDATYDVDPETVASTVHAVIRAAVKTTPLIVVGHGAQCIFGGRPNTLHVRVVAPFEARARRVAQRDAIAIEAARDEVSRRDKQRERYLRQYFNADPADASLYSLQTNTSRLDQERCIAAILAAVGAH